MNLEQQVCSLELAQKLKELGVKQESLWIWVRRVKHITTRPEWGVSYAPSLLASDSSKNAEWYSAFTVAELGNMYGDVMHALPDGREIYLSAKYDGKWRTGLSDGHIFEADTEADARAKMLIDLLEKGLLDAKQQEQICHNNSTSATGSAKSKAASGRGR